MYYYLAMDSEKNVSYIHISMYICTIFIIQNKG